MSRDTRTRSIIVVAVYTVLSFLGGLVKFGTPVGSIALDSWPGYFVAGHYSPFVGGIVAALGHLASAASAGFLLGWIHFVIAALQAVWALIFGYAIRAVNNIWGLIIASVVASLLNGLGAPFILAAVDPSHKGLYESIVPLLLGASILNVLVAAIMLMYIRRSRAPKI